MSIVQALRVLLLTAAVSSPALAQLPELNADWPYRANVDESVFERGGAGVTLHVSPRGNDRASGEERAPLKSIEAAWEKAIALQKRGRSVRLAVQPGTYVIEKPMELDAVGPERKTVFVIEGVGSQRPVLRRAKPDRKAMMRLDAKSNFVLRNLEIQNADVALDVNTWRQHDELDRNWVLESLVLTDSSIKLVLLYDFTFRDLSFRNSKFNTIIAEGQVHDLNMSGGGTWHNALRNVYFRSVRIEGSEGHGFRMDHVAENLVFEDCQFVGSAGRGAFFETAIGPVKFVNCMFADNADAGIALGAAHNFTFDRCRFENNAAAIDHYPRERSHNARKRGADNPANNLDRGRFSIFSDKDNKPLDQPILWKPLAYNRNIVVHDSVFRGSGQQVFVQQNKFKRPEAYARAVQEETRAWNNSYFNPDRRDVFEGAGGQWLTFEQWKAQSVQEDFEAGSQWGSAGIAQPGYTPPTPPLAQSGSDATPVSSDEGRLVYEVERLPFTASNVVLAMEDPDASGGVYHKLQADLIGDTGDWVQYTLEVPAPGDYHLVIRYLQDTGPFQYLGYAQLEMDGTLLGDWWDQTGVTRQFMSAYPAKVSLRAGQHKLRVRPVWRNGYLSGDYDITVDRIALTPTLDLRPAEPATDPASGEATLQWSLYPGDWNSLPDLDPLQPAQRGQSTTFDIGHEGHFAKRFDGHIAVPADGLYTFHVTANDGANLYLGDQLVVDNDGIHDGEDNQPWTKLGRIPLSGGRHRVRVDYFESGGKGRELAVKITGPGIPQPTPLADLLAR